jgi:hypothetical protein
MGCDWNTVSLEDAEERVWKEEQSLDERYRLPYLMEGFWGESYTCKQRDLYWVGIDLAKFYPSMSLKVVRNNLSKYSPKFCDEIGQLAACLLCFPLDLSEWSAEFLDPLWLRKGQKKLDGIPTGLAVAGFLANVGLLDVDQAVEKALRTEDLFRSKVAHFRYVDDHIILSTDYDVLLAWVRHYESLLREHGTNCSVKWEKTQPKELQSILSGHEDRAHKRRGKKEEGPDPKKGFKGRS